MMTERILAMPAPAPTTDSRERRALTEGLELRSAEVGGEQRTASGYAVLFNSEAKIYDMWVETIKPGAFTKSLQERDVLAIHSHDSGRVVGRMRAGTLTLREDAKGLAFENPLPDTTDGRDLAIQIDRGDIAGMSFGFIATRQEWDDTVEPPRRTIIEAELYEITYTAIPAYDDTEVGVRSLDAIRNERREHNKVCARSRIAARKARQAHAERRI
jgi:HK97 family phage prohead protease